MYCIFCKIVAKKEPMHIVYEDMDYLAFLDKTPYADGHTLVIPKKHTSSLTTTDDRENGNILEIVSKVAKMLKPILNCEGFFFNSNDGPKAHQVVPHLHWHIKPIYENSSQLWWKRPIQEYKPVAEVAEMIKQSQDQALYEEMSKSQKITKEQYEEVLNLIMGSPNDTYQRLENTLDTPKGFYTHLLTKILMCRPLIDEIDIIPSIIGNELKNARKKDKKFTKDLIEYARSQVGSNISNHRYWLAMALANEIIRIMQSDDVN